MSNSQKFIARNRAPRVQIEYDVELYGAQKKVQLPFVMGVGLALLLRVAGDPPVSRVVVVDGRTDDRHAVLVTSRDERRPGHHELGHADVLAAVLQGPEGGEDLPVGRTAEAARQPVDRRGAVHAGDHEQRRTRHAAACGHTHQDRGCRLVARPRVLRVLRFAAAASRGVA